MAKVSQAKSTMSNTAPITRVETVAADFQGYIVPPIEIPIKRRVNPAVHSRIPTSDKVRDMMKLPRSALLTVQLLQQLPFCLSLMKKFECGWVVEEEKQNHSQCDGNNVDVICPSPTKVGMLDEFSGFKQCSAHAQQVDLMINLPMIGPNVANGAFVAKMKLITIGRYLFGTNSPILHASLGETLNSLELQIGNLRDIKAQLNRLSQAIYSTPDDQ